VNRVVLIEAGSLSTSRWLLLEEIRYEVIDWNACSYSVFAAEFGCMRTFVHYVVSVIAQLPIVSVGRLWSFTYLQHGARVMSVLDDYIVCTTPFEVE